MGNSEAQGMTAPQVRTMADQQGWLPASEAELRDKKGYSLLVQSASIEEVEKDVPEGDALPDDV